MSMNINIENFFNNEYIGFAGFDNGRKIPSISDGLKTSQRKVLYTILKNNINSDKKEIKVEQLSAKTSEQTSYLHGAQSLNLVACGLAQKFVGSNNINILEPDGNFGTRMIPTPSAPRYIYTYLSEVSEHIFRKEDEPILEQQTFEGDIIEPKQYYPIIPLVLVNGTDGLSVGFSSNIIPRDPEEIINWLEAKLNHKTYSTDFVPYYKGYKGTISRDLSSTDVVKYMSKGDYIQDNASQLTITEIPIKYTLKSYLKVLDNLCDKDIIKSYKDLSDNDIFRFEVKVKREFFENKTKDDILQILKLTESFTDNLVLLDNAGKIKEYSSVEQILEEYYLIRYNAYEKRKNYYLNKLEKELEFNIERSRFIEFVISKTIKIDDEISSIINKLIEFNFKQFDNSYDYLLDMKISSLTKNKVEELTNKINNIKGDIDNLTNMSIEDMWLKELKELKNKLK